MKNLLYTFIALVTLNISARADGFKSKLNIRTFNNHSIIVEIDRINYNNPSSEFIINDLTPGDHKIKIWTVGSQHHNYTHGPRPGNFRLAYNGFITIPAGARVKAILTYQNILKVIDIDPLRGNIHQDCNNTITFIPGYCGHYYGNNNNYGCNIVHSDQFIEFKGIVAHENFDDIKISMCKQYIRTHPINSTELKVLLGLITYDRNRIDLAKYSYAYVNDPDKFYTVYNAFTFDSSINELINWINHQS